MLSSLFSQMESDKGKKEGILLHDKIGAEIWADVLKAHGNIQGYFDNSGIEHIRISFDCPAQDAELWECFTLEPGESPLELFAEDEPFSEEPLI